jgi:hypothetical protein
MKKLYVLYAMKDVVEDYGFFNNLKEARSTFIKLHCWLYSDTNYIIEEYELKNEFRNEVK